MAVRNAIIVSAIPELAAFTPGRLSFGRDGGGDVLVDAASSPTGRHGSDPRTARTKGADDVSPGR